MSKEQEIQWSETPRPMGDALQSYNHHIRVLCGDKWTVACFSPFLGWVDALAYRRKIVNPTGWLPLYPERVETEERVEIAEEPKTLSSKFTEDAQLAVDLKYEAIGNSKFKTSSKATWSNVTLHGAPRSPEMETLVMDWLGEQARKDVLWTPGGGAGGGACGHIDRDGSWTPPPSGGACIHIYAGTCPYAEEICSEEAWIFAFTEEALNHQQYENARDI